VIRDVPTTLLLAGIVACATGACGRRTVSDPADWSIDVRPLAVPAQTGSREPQLTGSGPDVVLSWLEHAGATNTLKFSQRAGSGWGAPMTVVSGTDWFVSYADPPAVMRLSDGRLVAQWLQQTDPRIEAMDLRLSSRRTPARPGLDLSLRTTTARSLSTRSRHSSSCQAGRSAWSGSMDVKVSSRPTIQREVP